MRRKEFEERAENIKPGKGTKIQIVTQVIERQVGEFTISEIERECPGVSRPMIRVILENLRAKGEVEVLGTGRSARWRKRDNEKLLPFLKRLKRGLELLSGFI